MTASNAAWPEKLDSSLTEILGLMMWHTGPMAARLRRNGQEIPRKAELEQAFVMHWLIGLYLQHGDGWRPAAAKLLKEPG